IASSNNGGRTWSYSVSKESLLPPDFQGNGGFGAANCFGNDDDIRCIATGSYEDQDSTQYPLVALSTNGGKTWSYPVSKTSIATTKPTNYSGGGVFNGASCSGKGTKAICIASGSYEEGDLLQNPMVSLSSNGGMTWSYPIDSKTLPIDFLKGASLFGANCIGTGSTTQCMATGNYIAKNLITYPLLIASSNAGVTWNYSIEKTKKLPAAYQNEGILTAVNCSEGTGICLASGLYVTNGIQFPLLALSSKGDPTQWTFPIEKGRTLPKGFISQGFLAGIN
ncbi:MAG: sialidase family protein, partial [bacterium]|nr:sialidase family protein [bacterium]